MLGWIPDLLTRPFLRAPDGVSLIGIDEDTAIVGGPKDYTVHGRQSAWLLGAGRRREYPAGAELVLS
jgi:hypothetical protein